MRQQPQSRAVISLCRGQPAIRELRKPRRIGRTRFTCQEIAYSMRPIYSSPQKRSPAKRPSPPEPATPSAVTSLYRVMYRAIASCCLWPTIQMLKVRSITQIMSVLYRLALMLRRFSPSVRLRSESMKTVRRSHQ